MSSMDVDVVFARTRHTYDSYTDFYRLVVASQYETCYVDDIDLTRSAVYVTTPANGETQPAILAARERAGSALRGKVVWWNLERPDNIEFKAVLDDVFGYIDGAWVSDRAYARLDARMTYVPMGSDAKIARSASEPMRYDVCHLAYLWGRREAVVNQLRERGVRVAPEAWGARGQDQVLPVSRLMLNMHQYPGLKIVAPIRVAVASAYRLPLLTEDIEDAGLLQEDDFEQVPYDNLVEAVQRLLAPESQAHRARLANNLHERLCVAHPFRCGVTEGVAMTRWR